jgi:branched-chain amino acid transport system ATP-binding protein
MLLEVRDLHASYGLSQVLFGVSLEAGRGEIVALLGRNGVGKSTTMRAILGLTPPRSGSVRWKGREVARREPHRNAADGIGYVPEDRRIFAELTVWENLDVARRPAREGSGWDEARVYALFPELDALRERKGGVLSGGQQQMLTIARSLMGNPELLLLDEPSEGLAPLIVEKVRQAVLELKRSGMAIVLAEQNLDFVLSVSDRVHILEKGAVQHTGTPAELRADPSLLERYLSV